MKVLAIALDAASYHAFRKLESYMPTVSKLRANGLSGILKTVPPPTTAIGFPAMFQGLNPGKSRSFCFENDQPDYRLQFFNKADKLVGDRVWDILSREGYKCLVLNLPMTYPAKPLNGILISSFDSTGEDWTWPPDLKSKLSFDPRERNIRKFHDLNEYARYWFARTRVIKNIALNLLSQDNFDFAFIGFLILDRLGHYLMHLKQAEPLFRWAHKLIDDAIAELIAKTKPEHVIIASDHGMHPVSKAFCLNTWLFEKGYLAIRRDLEELFLMYPLSITPDKFDLAYSPAWSVGQGAIVLNHECWASWIEMGLQDEIIEGLQREYDPDGGLSPFSKIMRREEVWHGPYLEQMPDILCLPNKGYLIHWVRLLPRRYQTIQNYSDHDMDGFYCISPAPHAEQTASILDITPTILSLMEVKIPDDLDGRPLQY